MKLLVVSQYFYPEQFRVSDVCFQLVSMGHEVTVLTGLPNYPAGEIYDSYDWKSLERKVGFHSDLKAYKEIINGVTVLRSKLSPRKSGKKHLAWNYLSFAYFASKTAYKMVRSSLSNYDKILIFQYSPITMAIPGVILKNKLKKPLLLYCFDLWPESIVSAGLKNQGLLYQGILKLSRWIYKKADSILISSKNFRKYFNEKLNIYNNIYYLPIYAEDIFKTIQKAELGKSTSDLIMINLLFAGNIGEMQSMETIIHAANLIKQHNNIHFHIVGDGSALERSVQQAKKLSLQNITFHGRHPLEEMPTYYEIADAFLVTLKKNEFISYTLPGKVQSYMAAGKPILAAIDGEASDVIKESGCGLCCPAEDAAGLAEIILEFAENKENRQNYGDRSRIFYDENFSAEVFFSSLLEHLE